MQSGDNTAALQSAINTSIGRGTPLYIFGSGSCSSTLNITGSLRIVGAGMDNTVLSLAGAPGLKITTSAPFSFEHIQIVGTYSGTNQDVISVTAASGNENVQSAFIRVGITVPPGCTGLHWIKASGWSMAHMRFGLSGNNSTGCIIENQNNGDSGDNKMTDIQFWATVNGLAGTTGLLWRSSGG